MDAFTVVKIVAPLLSILGNCIALDGVISAEIAMAGYRRFLISLLASDLYICGVKLLLTSMEITVRYVDVSMQLHKCFGEIGRSLEITGFIAYILNLCGMFVDHYIALLHPYRYKFLMKKWGAKMAVFMIWPLAFIIGFIAHPIRALVLHLKNTTIGSVPSPTAIPPQTNCTNVAHYDYSPFFNSYYYDGAEPASSAEFADDSNNAKDGLPPCKPNGDTAAALLDAVRRGLDFEAGNFEKSWCASFDRTSNLWVDWIVVVLAVFAAVFLAICYTLFRRAIRKAGRAKQKLHELSITTALLLVAFSLCWMPFICYELFMEMIFQAHPTMLKESPSQTLSSVYKTLHVLFVCSPLLVPVIYVARLKVVQRSIIKRYRIVLATCLGRKMSMTLLYRDSAVSDTEANGFSTNSLYGNRSLNSQISNGPQVLSTISQDEQNAANSALKLHETVTKL